MKHRSRKGMRGGSSDVYVDEVTGDVAGDYSGDVVPDTEVVGTTDDLNNMMSSDQSGGKHRHSKRCKHSMKKHKGTKKSMKKRKGTKKSTKKRSTKKRSTKKRSTKKRSTKKRKGTKSSTKKSKKSMRKGGGVLETAAVPFGLVGLQHFFKKNSVKKMSNKAKSSFTKVTKMF